MKWLAVVVLTTSLRAEGACPCVATPANPKQTSAEGKPAYVGQAAAYGWGCAAHDGDAGHEYCKTSQFTSTGQKDDWCLDKFCIVDPKTCDSKTRLISYTANTTDYFSYEACDANFKGNGWVGRCKNCEKPHVNSFCTCGGLAGCKCLAGATKQEYIAEDKPAYPAQQPAYGWGCKAHDAGHDSCGTSKLTSAGQADDWCLDKFCLVDPAACDSKTRLITYTANPTDYFSYDTC